MKNTHAHFPRPGGPRAPAKRRPRLVPSLLAAAAVILVTGSVTHVASAAYPGVNGKIAFVTDQIYVMEADGTNVQKLTTGSQKFEPAVSPDGSKIAYRSGQDIWVMSADGSNQTRLTSDGSTNLDPTWSPDGTKIAFATSRTGLVTTIWVMNADGSNQHKVIDRYPSSHAVDPAWSPDGSRLAYVRPNPIGEIATASAADGSGEVILTAGFNPSWSPDSSSIAYRYGSFGGDIWVIGAAGGTGTNLTADAADDRFPAFSPDGTQIAYAALILGRTHIFRINADGTGKVNLTNDNPPGSSNPDWGPAPALPLDTTPPSVNCGSPDGLWHASDVSIPCTASDGGSGLADPADASFSLVTSVAAGVEDANASTNSRQVCDTAGNCSTAGPIAGNMVDKKAPSISIGAPASGVYLLNAAVAASYGCSDGGSGVASCSGPVASGSNIDTASVGSNSFTVVASDTVGNSASQTVSYDVAYAVFLLSNPAKPSKTIKLQLHDANGVNVSDPAIVLTAQSIDGSLPASGTFTYSNGLDGYRYMVKTTGLASGSHTLEFKAGADPTVHSAAFAVR
jgi:Tol biopolymer transport system component